MAQNYQPIENYGVIGDLNTIALVGLNGSIDFMCFPNFDSPSIFAALLDHEKGGSFTICPHLHDFNTKQLYLPDTNVLLTLDKGCLVYHLFPVKPGVYQRSHQIYPVG